MVFKVDVPDSLIAGDVDDGYGPIADAFRKNFAEHGEIGAACAVYRDGRKVVDLWGGYADGRTRRPWAEDTVVTMFSTTKGVSSMAIALAHSRGVIDYDATVASYWPDFAQAGKAGVTVRQLLSHQAGLPAISTTLDLDVLGSVDLLSAALASEAPSWEPGTRHGYHGITLGWYESELLRHADPQGRTLGRFFADEVAAPLGLDFWIGLPNSIGEDRRATIHGYRPPELLLHLHEMPPRFVLGFLNPTSITFKAFGNPRILGILDNYNRRDVLRIELPAANGTGTVRSVAAAYGEFATGGTRLGLRPDTLDALKRPAEPPGGGLFDVVLRTDTIFSLGYVKPFPRFRFGSRAGLAFGTPGAGGSFGFADPDTGVGFAYAMNRTGFRLWDDPRELALRQALYSAIGSDPQDPD